MSLGRVPVKINRPKKIPYCTVKQNDARKPSAFARLSVAIARENFCEMLCAQTFCRRSRPTGALVQQRGISRKERAANEGLRGNLDTKTKLDPNRKTSWVWSVRTKQTRIDGSSSFVGWVHEVEVSKCVFKAECCRLVRGPPKLQKQVLLRQIRALKPERHCSYKGQSIEDLKRELAELQNTKQATLE